jgi:hypothetical protein
MTCERNEMLQHVVPLLDALSGRIVTSLALYDQLSSAPGLAAAGPGKVAGAVSAASADALSKAAGAVSKVRGLGGGSGLSAEAIAAQARRAVSTISTRVSQQLMISVNYSFPSGFIIVAHQADQPLRDGLPQ